MMATLEGPVIATSSDSGQSRVTARANKDRLVHDLN
jgi:hypothetical protein